MKRKINLIGDTFTHLTGGNKGYSVHGKESKYIEWVLDNSSDITFYVDDKIIQALSDHIGGIKYGWLHESKHVIADIVLEVRNNYEKYFEVFENIFTHNKELLDLDSRFKWVPANGFWIKDAKIYQKSKMISFITSNKNFTPGHKVRLNWVDKIGDQVDLYGRGFNEIENKENGLCDYMFSVVIENGFYDSYYTEKILDCFATGTIPVYLGSPDIGNYFNLDGIIPLSEEFDISEEIYYNKISSIMENLEKVKKIEILEDYIFKMYLEKNNAII
jgi:hypothetical protein